mgnify:CR=1 FL=1
MQQHAAKRRRAGTLVGDHSIAAADEGPVPLLVRVLGGNPVTSLTVLACLNAADARYLRQLHPAVAGTVAGVPWCDTDTPVIDLIRWRAGLPAAVGARLVPSVGGGWLTSEPAVAALGGLTRLDLRECEYVTDDVLLRLPTSLRALNVRCCRNLTPAASFVHLAALASLDCSNTRVACERTDGLPPSLRELDIRGAYVLLPGPHDFDVRAVAHLHPLAHLRQLRVLHADSGFDTSTLASLPPSLVELHAARSRYEGGGKGLTPAASFAHLTALRVLDVAQTAIGNSSLATLPPSLVCLGVRSCSGLTPAAVLPHLPALRILDVSETGIGDALVASLPASLLELRLIDCPDVTSGASLDHLHALRVLDCMDTKLAPAALAGCRARGCAAPAVRQLRGHSPPVVTLAVLGDGRLASGDYGVEVQLLDVEAEGEATGGFRAGGELHALAVMRDGRYLAAGTASWEDDEDTWEGNDGVEVWDVACVPPEHRATINCHSGVKAVAALADGRLAAGCDDGRVRVVDVDAGAVVTTLRGHMGGVTALAVLPDDMLASGSTDGSARVWDVGARACVATLAGHTSGVSCLAVLPDGRLASGARGDNGVRLWDVGARTCVGVLAGGVKALAALPDGRLATVFSDDTLGLWDTRPAAAAGASRAVGAVPVVVWGRLWGQNAGLLLLPDGRLASGCSVARDGAVYLLDLPPPAVCE